MHSKHICPHCEQRIGCGPALYKDEATGKLYHLAHAILAGIDVPDDIIVWYCERVLTHL